MKYPSVFSDKSSVHNLVSYFLSNVSPLQPSDPRTPSSSLKKVSSLHSNKSLLHAQLSWSETKVTPTLLKRIVFGHSDPPIVTVQSQRVGTGQEGHQMHHLLLFATMKNSHLHHQFFKPKLNSKQSGRPFNLSKHCP